MHFSFNYRRETLFCCLALALFIAGTAKAENLLKQGDMKSFHMWDDLYDGVDEQGNLHVFTYGEEVMCEGFAPVGRPFGASPCWADVTGDGKPELIVGDALGFIWIYTPSSPPNTFPPTFTTGVFVRTYFGNALNLDIFDYTGDGINDIIAGTADGAIQIVPNFGGGVFVKQDYAPNYRFIDTKALGRDRKFDMSKMFPLLMRGQNPLFTGLYAAPRFVDWNRDGKPDLVVGEGGYSANSIYVYINKSATKAPDFSGSKREWLAYGNGRESLSPAIGDLDGDGDMDLLVGERVGYLTWFENKPRPEGSGADTPYLLEPKGEPLPIGGQTKAFGELLRPLLVDLDGDKDLDLVVGQNDGKIAVCRNSGTAKAPVFDAPVFLKGVDTAKPRKVPDGWGWDRHEMQSGGHSAFMCVWSQETDAQNGAATTFGRMCFNYRYMGLPGEIEAGCEVEFHVPYELTFKARARGVSGVHVRFGQSAERFAAGDTMQQKDKVNEFDTTPGDAWRTFRQSFEFAPLTSNTTSKTTGFHVRFYLTNPTPDFFVDITDVTVERKLATPEAETAEATKPKPATP